VVNIYKHAFPFWHCPGIEPGTLDPKSDTVTTTPPPPYKCTLNSLCDFVVASFHGDRHTDTYKRTDTTINSTYLRCWLLRSVASVGQSVCWAGDCSYSFARRRHFDAATTLPGWLGGSEVSVAAFGPRDCEFDAHSLLRFPLPGEAWRSEQLTTVISVT